MRRKEYSSLEPECHLEFGLPKGQRKNIWVSKSEQRKFVCVNMQKFVYKFWYKKAKHSQGE
jgi:hypothetical protein